MNDLLGLKLAIIYSAILFLVIITILKHPRNHLSQIFTETNIQICFYFFPVFFFFSLLLLFSDLNHHFRCVYLVFFYYIHVLEFCSLLFTLQWNYIIIYKARHNLKSFRGKRKVKEEEEREV